MVTGETVALERSPPPSIGRASSGFKSETKVALEIVEATHAERGHCLRPGRGTKSYASQRRGPRKGAERAGGSA